MKNNFNPGVILTLMWVLTIALSIISGILAWNWVEPESFLGALGFIILWGILIRVSHFIVFGLIAAIFDK